MIPGVVTVGLFAHRTADVLIVGSQNGVKVIRRDDQNRDEFNSSLICRDKTE